MLVTKEIEIDMGHRVPFHKTKCKNLHGHRYKIEVGVDDNVITEAGMSDEGMVIDFGDLKQVMVECLDDVYDHSFTIYKNDPFIEVFQKLKNYEHQKINIVDFIPTAENLAKHWFEIVLGKLRVKRINIKHVKVWETPTSTAIYTVDNFLQDNMSIKI